MILKYQTLATAQSLSGHVIICYHLQPFTVKHKSKVCPSTKTARWVQLSEPPRGAILFSTGGKEGGIARPGQSVQGGEGA